MSYAEQSLGKFHARPIEKRRVLLLVNMYGHLRKSEARRCLRCLDVEVLHVMQKSCNASVVCNTFFSCRLKTGTLPAKPLSLCYPMIIWMTMLSDASSAQILIIQFIMNSRSGPSPPNLRGERWLTFPKKTPALSSSFRNRGDLTRKVE